MILPSVFTTLGTLLHFHWQALPVNRMGPLQCMQCVPRVISPAWQMKPSTIRWKRFPCAQEAHACALQLSQHQQTPGRGCASALRHALAGTCMPKCRSQTNRSMQFSHSLAAACCTVVCHQPAGALLHGVHLEWPQGADRVGPCLKQLRYHYTCLLRSSSRHRAESAPCSAAASCWPCPGRARQCTGP